MVRAASDSAGDGDWVGIVLGISISCCPLFSRKLRLFAEKWLVFKTAYYFG